MPKRPTKKIQKTLEYAILASEMQPSSDRVWYSIHNSEAEAVSAAEARLKATGYCQIILKRPDGLFVQMDRVGLSVDGVVAVAIACGCDVFQSLAMVTKSITNG